MFLYVIGFDHCVKIGFSKNPEKRLKQLQTAQNNKLTLYYKSAFNPEKIKQYEKQLHKELSHKKIAGEWFDLTHEEATLHINHLKIFYEEQEYLLR